LWHSKTGLAPNVPSSRVQGTKIFRTETFIFGFKQTWTDSTPRVLAGLLFLVSQSMSFRKEVRSCFCPSLSLICPFIRLFAIQIRRL